MLCGFILGKTLEDTDSFIKDRQQISNLPGWEEVGRRGREESQRWARRRLKRDDISIVFIVGMVCRCIRVKIQPMHQLKDTQFLVSGIKHAFNKAITKSGEEQKFIEVIR